MKTINLFTLLVVGACSLQACHNSDKKENSSTMAGDSTLDTTSKTAQSLGGKVNEVDIDFIKKAAVGGLMEVGAGDLALQKTKNPKVKSFAEMMVKDHTAANTELAALATSKGLSLPTTFPAEEQKHMDVMQTLAGNAFDKHYIAMMVTDHNKTIDLFTKAATSEDQDIRNFANKVLPIIKGHYKTANEMNNDMIKLNTNNGDDLLNISTGDKKKNDQ